MNAMLTIGIATGVSIATGYGASKTAGNLQLLLKAVALVSIAIAIEIASTGLASLVV